MRKLTPWSVTPCIEAVARGFFFLLLLKGHN